jgi:hypothetical protein
MILEPLVGRTVCDGGFLNNHRRCDTSASRAANLGRRSAMVYSHTGPHAAARRTRRRRGSKECVSRAVRILADVLNPGR